VDFEAKQNNKSNVERKGSENCKFESFQRPNVGPCDVFPGANGSYAGQRGQPQDGVERDCCMTGPLLRNDRIYYENCAVCKIRESGEGKKRKDGSSTRDIGGNDDRGYCRLACGGLSLLEGDERYSSQE
jgi:hypothetical protein